jgi:hypothetical protein
VLFVGTSQGALGTDQLVTFQAEINYLLLLVDLAHVDLELGALRSRSGVLVVGLFLSDFGQLFMGFL